MRLLGLIERSITQRKLSSTLTALSVALGVMLVAAIGGVMQAMEDNYEKPGKGYSLVVGPAGSPLTLVLNSIFHVEQSRGLLPFRIYEEMKASRLVKHAVPYAVGDMFRGFRVVATTDGVFDPYFPHPESETTPGKFSEGGPFVYDPLALVKSVALSVRNPVPEEARDAKALNQAVVGSVVADKLELRVGDRIEPTHGVESTSAHEEQMLWRVTGILKRTGTPIDRVVFINLDSFYRIPEHAGGVRVKEDGSVEAALSSVLVFPKPKIAKALLLTRLRQREDLQVAEVREQLDKLFSIVGNVRYVFMLVAAMVVVIGVISVMVSIYNTMNERRREIAIMRAIGARRSTVLSAIVGEATVLAFCGALAGLLLGCGLVAAVSAYVERQAGFRPDPLAVLSAPVPGDLADALLRISGGYVDLSAMPFAPVLVGVVTMTGAIAGMIPAWKAYRTDVATNLAPLS